MRSNNTIKFVLEKRFCEILESEKIAHDNYIVVLKGFSKFMISTIANIAAKNNCEVCIPSVSPLNISMVATEARTFITKLMSSGDKPIICLYEQYLSVSDTLNAGVKLTDRTIVIIENNLFLSVVPSLLQQDIAETLLKYFESDSRTIAEELEIYTHFYSDVCRLGNSEYGVKHINKHLDEKIAVIPFFSLSKFESQPETEGGCAIETLTDEFWQYIVDILNGKLPEAITIIRNEQKSGDNISAALITLLSMLGISYSVKKYNSFEQLIDSTRSFLPLLKQQHGETAEFRMLRFYKCPNKSNELVELSQETVISDIVTQSEKALSGNADFKNLFITAPTGAGKSLLF